MAHPDKQIVDFIGEHHILTLAVARNNVPYCATCYYAYQKETNTFIFTSDHDTRHIRDFVADGNYQVAAAIALETRLIGKIRGIQITGVMHPMDGDELAVARAAYLKRFPIARLMPNLHLWALVPGFIKMTDNRLGFGKKLIWTPGDPQKPASDAE